MFVFSKNGNDATKPKTSMKFRDISSEGGRRRKLSPNKRNLGSYDNQGMTAGQAKEANIATFKVSLQSIAIFRGTPTNLPDAYSHIYRGQHNCDIVYGEQISTNDGNSYYPTWRHDHLKTFDNCVKDLNMNYVSDWLDLANKNAMEDFVLTSQPSAGTYTWGFVSWCSA